MATYDWNSQTGDWSDAADWSGGPPDPPPDPGDATVDINAPGLYSGHSLVRREIFEAGTVTVGDTNAVLALNGTSELVVEGDFNNSGLLFLNQEAGDGGANMTIAGTLTNQGFIDVGTPDGSLSAAATLTLGRFLNDGGAESDVYGSANALATVDATELTSNSGVDRSRRLFAVRRERSFRVLQSDRDGNL